MPHTPGPWGIDRAFLRVLSETGPVATVLKWLNRLEHGDNLRLVAAAPDLLIALRDTADIIEDQLALIVSSCCTPDGKGGYLLSTISDDGKTDFERFTHALLAARKAITKAGA
jgi:hypothetical protein